METKKEQEKQASEDNQQLAQFVLNFAGFTLKQAGYDCETYSFFLKTAFRRQLKLQEKEWDYLVKKSQNGELLNWDFKDEALEERIAAFTQSLVTEVIEASEDNLAIKLLKTNYLSILDSAWKTSMQAIQALNGNNPKAELINPEPDQTQQFTDLLKSHLAYLDALADLPFILEALGRSITNNTGVNYQPGKTTEMLVNVLDTFKAAVTDENEGEARILILEGLKLSLQFTLPDVPIGSEFTEAILRDYLPYFDKLITRTRDFGAKKALIFPENKDSIVAARKEMLAAMDVHLYTLDELLQETLIEPLRLCNETLGTAADAACAINAIALDVRTPETPTKVQELFKNLDKISKAYNLLDPALFPPCLSQANNFYRELKDGAAKAGIVVQGAVSGLNTIYNSAWTLVSHTMSNYLGQVNALNAVFTSMKLNGMKSAQSDEVMALFAFYELVQQGEIHDQALKEKLFTVYIGHMRMSSLAEHRVDCLGKSNFDNYLKIETQLQNKFNLKESIAASIDNYINNMPVYLTQSFICATGNIGLLDPRQFHILLLINRLQTLEKTFDLTKPQSALVEVYIAAEKIKNNSPKEIQVFKAQFLLPLMRRLYSKYQNEFLIPLVEDLLNTTTHNSHQLPRVYSKLKESMNLSVADINLIKDYYQEHRQNSPVMASELEAATGIASLLGSTKYPQREWKTPKQEAKSKVVLALERFKVNFDCLLAIVQEGLDKQLSSCKALETLTANNLQIRDLCAQKIQYLNALNKFINLLKDEINEPFESPLKKQLMQLLSGQLIPLATEAVLARMQVSAIPEVACKLMSFVRRVMPLTSDTKSQANNDVFYNLLAYYLGEQNPLSEVIRAKTLYDTSLNRNPIPALMKELSCPLELTNILPSQEKVMDVILDKLFAAAKETSFSWGLNYLKHVVSGFTYEQLVKNMPYPFLANLALQAIQSEAVQKQMAPIIDSLKQNTVDLANDKIKELAKNQLYPLIGIEIEKTVESSAFAYIENPQRENVSGRDAFAMLYLKYREINKHNNTRFDSEKTLRFLFPQLLAEVQENDELAKDQQKKIIATLEEKFKELDKLIPYSQVSPLDAIEETNQQLQFIINSISLQNSETNNLVRLTLVGRFLIMAMDASEKLNDETQRNLLQIKAIESLSQALKKIAELEREAFDSQALSKVLSVANIKISKEQLKGLKKSLEVGKTRVTNQVADLKELLKSENTLGRSLKLSQYYQSPPIRKFSILLSKIVGFASPVMALIAMFTALLASKGFLAGLLAALGLSGGMGIAIFAGFMTFCFLWNLVNYLKDEFPKLEAIHEGKAPFLERLWKITAIVLQTTSWALIKTLFGDFLLKSISDLLAIQLFTDACEKVHYWPTRNQVMVERNKLASLGLILQDLEKLVDQQIDFLDSAIDPKTNKIHIDRSEKIREKMYLFNMYFPHVIEQLKKVKKTDARFSEKNYQKTLDALEESFKGLKTELNRLQNLQNAQGQAGAKVIEASQFELPISISVSTIAVSTREFVHKPPIEVNFQAFKNDPQTNKLQARNAGFSESVCNAVNQVAGYFTNWRTAKTVAVEKPLAVDSQKEEQRPVAQDKIARKALVQSGSAWFPKSKEEVISLSQKQFEQAQLTDYSTSFLDTK